MGYTTKFRGTFTLDRPLTEAQAEYIVAFCDTRRMRRNAAVAVKMPDPKRLAVGLPIGNEAEYFVGGLGFMGQDDDASMSRRNNDTNTPPAGQPGLWCQWVPTDDRGGIEWDGGEKFYDYTAWLTYIVEHFLKPWGYVLNGRVEWQGEDMDDRGALIVEDNHVRTESIK